MKQLNEKILNEIKLIQAPIPDLWKNGEKDKVEKLYIDVWNKIPDPKHDWSDSQYILISMFNFYLLINKPAKLLEYIPILESLYSEGKNDLTVATKSAIVYYETDQFDKAYDGFHFMFQQFKTRPFQGLDRKYFDFYLMEKKKRLTTQKK